MPAPGLTVVTGATAGIGAAFARRFAAERRQLLLVARDQERLASVASALAWPASRRSEAEPAVKRAADAAQPGGTVDVVAADLSTADGCAAVEERLRGRDVDMLVNNAGIGMNRNFVESTLDAQERLLRLNVHAVMRLTLAVLPGMVARGRGDVINVSSTAGFGVPQPGSTYSASKAWVTNFSDSIGQSVRRHGVRVMALCPGYTRTEFHDRAGINMSKAPAWMWLDADEVVRVGLRDLRRGRLISVPDWKYKVATAAMRHLPRPLLRAATRDLRARTGRDQNDRH